MSTLGLYFDINLGNSPVKVKQMITEALISKLSWTAEAASASVSSN